MQNKEAIIFAMCLDPITVCRFSMAHCFDRNVHKTHAVQIVINKKLQSERHMRFMRLINFAENCTILEKVGDSSNKQRVVQIYF